jgi:ribokinase
MTNYQKISIIIPNQKETEMLTGVKVIDELSAKQAVNLHNKGIETVIITMGAMGAFVFMKINIPDTRS